MGRYALVGGKRLSSSSFGLTLGLLFPFFFPASFAPTEQHLHIGFQGDGGAGGGGEG